MVANTDSSREVMQDVNAAFHQMSKRINLDRIQQNPQALLLKLVLMSLKLRLQL